jgi:hypothetical protein
MTSEPLAGNVSRNVLETLDRYGGGIKDTTGGRRERTSMAGAQGNSGTAIEQAGSVVSGDSMPIGYWRTGDGPPLVLVHGTSADHACWDPVLPALGEHFSVYAIDRRGQAGSGDATEHSLEREAEDVAAVIEAVAREHGAPVGLVGHSYGAICCLEAALRLRGRLLGGLVLYEPPLPTGAVAFPAGPVGRVEALIEGGDRDEAVAVFLREVAGVPPTRWTGPGRSPTGQNGWRRRTPCRARPAPRRATRPTPPGCGGSGRGRCCCSGARARRSSG